MLSTSKLLTSSISKDPAADASAEAHASVNLWHNKTIFQCLVKNGDFSTEKYHERKKSWRESSLGSHSIVVVA
jgi:hypothetical protein